MTESGDDSRLRDRYRLGETDMTESGDPPIVEWRCPRCRCVFRTREDRPACPHCRLTE